MRAMQAADSIPIVISGPPRSGTTLLYNLFDGHPDVVWLFREGYFFEHVCDLGDQAEAAFAALEDLSIDDIVAGLWDRQLLPPPASPSTRDGSRRDITTLRLTWDDSAFRAQLAAERPRDPATAWAWLLRAELAGLGWQPKPFVCLKAADYGKSCEGALRTLPHARAVAIVRDPYRALDSLKGSREQRGVKRLTWPTLAHCVAEMNRLVDRVGDLPAERLRCLRYEALIGDRETVMRDLAAWLGLDYCDSMLRPTNAGAAWAPNSTFADGGRDEAESAAPLRTLNQAEIAFIRRTAGPFAAHFGYDLAAPPQAADAAPRAGHEATA